jgi:hypothetical protein
MNFEFLIPIALFASIAYAIKAVVDARVRRQMVESNGSQELVRSIVESEEARRRHGSLRWGVVLLALGIGFAAVGAQGLDEVTPGVLATLLIATGLGNLAYFVAARKLTG